MSKTSPVELHPLYGQPPITFQDARVVVAMLAQPLPVELPPRLQPTGGISVVMIADYPSSDLGPYRELFALTAATIDGQSVWYCPFIYVTSDAAMAAGREIWGYPKKIADIACEFGDHDSIRARLRRGDATIEITGSVPAAVDPSVMAAASQPIVNEKIIPSVDGGAPDVQVLTAVTLDFVPETAYGGAGTITTSSTPADPFGDLIPTGSSCGISLIGGDATLPAGKVL